MAEMETYRCAETATPQQSQMLMGHRDRQTIGYYINGLVGVDSQSMVRGRPEHVALLDKHTSMMAKRDLSAPLPPGSQLIKTTQTSLLLDDDGTMELASLTPSEHYEMRRQSRNKAFRKEREEFFERDRSSLTGGVAVSNRSASRYLKALWKFDPDRETLVNEMFLDGKVDVGIHIGLEKVIKHMVNIADPGRRRYSYKSAEPLPGNTCSDCEKQLDSYVCTRPACYSANFQ